MGGQLTNLIPTEVGNFKPPKMGNFTPPLTPHPLILCSMTLGLYDVSPLVV